MLLDPIADAVNIKVSRSNIKVWISAAANKLKSIMAVEMKHKLVSIKLDSASRHGRHVLGINAQYELNGKLVIRTLGMIEVDQRQTAVFLRDKVLETLRVYDLKLDQIFSITVDNGSNMVAAVKKIKSLLNESIAVSTLLFEDDENIPQERDLIEELELEWDARISLVRCAVHSLQLAIADVFDKADPNLKCITEVVRHLRQIKYKSFVEVQQLALPPLWSPTRWGGKYKMLSSILKQEAKFVELGTQYSEMCKLRQFNRSNK
ncbi:uncharacterized protein LOC129780248 [Toxorhynchites rutilus septentrionalis]|uniref:uncharacterized protein LOC129780248 n=1 Tax=Toxorhynchites rutilus septentrionalis TaxID=329112 RepID=UPI00247A56BA|nr:uncharacterized protein LOC129780248 [Toxorhynchites rutilus septentrionalis]